MEEMLEEKLDLTVTVTMNKYCLLECPVTASFGTRPTTGSGCDVQRNDTGKLSPGETDKFSVDTASVVRESDEEYCFRVSACGYLGEFLDSMEILTRSFSF